MSRSARCKGWPLGSGTGRYETFEDWREREHDDLVLSVALACWYGQHKMNRAWVFV
ncbi:MAG TPA: hypothetical protein VMS17_30655 [Gemmataceae bacterium]|nr:hypothetical protein [Gemmataceae bacterium]